MNNNNYNNNYNNNQQNNDELNLVEIEKVENEF